MRHTARGEEEEEEEEKGEARKEARGLRLGGDFRVPSTPRARERARPNKDGHREIIILFTFIDYTFPLLQIAKNKS